MKCAECRDALLESLDAGPGAPLSPTVRDHLDTCTDCRSWWDDIRPVAECLEKVAPATMEAPPIESVWRRIEEKTAKLPRWRASFPWIPDLLWVFATASVVLVFVDSLHGLVGNVVKEIPGISSSMLEVLKDPFVFVGMMALFAMLAGACSFPLIARTRPDGLWRQS